jgi:hypothetical protein
MVASQRHFQKAGIFDRRRFAQLAFSAHQVLPDQCGPRFLLDLATISVYSASSMERTELIAELEAAVTEQKRCLGGVYAARAVSSPPVWFRA